MFYNFFIIHFKKKLITIKQIFQFLWVKEEKLYLRFLFSLILIAVSMLLNTSIPIVLKNIIDKISFASEKLGLQLVILLISYGVIWALAQIIGQLRLILMFKPLGRSISLLTIRLFEHLHSLPIKFHIEKETGSISSILARAQDGIPNLFWGLFFYIIPTTIEILLATFILYYFYGLLYGSILLIIIIIFIIYTIFISDLVANKQGIANENLFKANSYMVDSLLNFMSVKYFNNKDYEITRYRQFLEKREKTLVNYLTYAELVRLGQGVIMGFGVIILTFMAGYNTLMQKYSISDFVLINGYILQFVSPLGFFGVVVQNVKTGLKDLENTFNILKIQKNITESRTPVIIKNFQKLEFKHVSFNYNTSSLLKNINFKISAGEIASIVGSTGSGKSTITLLLFRLYDINSGEIIINDTNIKEIKLANLNSMISIVPQNISLFNTSIYNNILYGLPNATEENVNKVIEITQLTELIKKLPEGWNTIVGERGIKLSGGEQQKIIIARALLKNAPVCIFDEATSSLDTDTEKQIMSNIMSTYKNTTFLIIAHRLSTIINSDKIIVINNGIIQEQGKHKELLNKKGVYYRLWKNMDTESND